jgi:hypothetical protein
MENKFNNFCEIFSKNKKFIFWHRMSDFMREEAVGLIPCPEGCRRCPKRISEPPTTNM